MAPFFLSHSAMEGQINVSDQDKERRRPGRAPLPEVGGAQPVGDAAQVVRLVAGSRVSGADQGLALRAIACPSAGPDNFSPSNSGTDKPPRRNCAPSASPQRQRLELQVASADILEPFFYAPCGGLEGGLGHARP